ncbi:MULTISPECIES: rod shape-determining protein MreC [unclassified Thermosynechococcus]|uniref:rod shape-determining protein MreC n=1 Tax=unclassified Thermosynechococcus TaxID=2622553 RepID=UPI00287768A1|nr:MULTISPECIES: rod shape-determining protein MreC [unclassified Thermosynechococcus]WNC53657.1 rod shape-determining protein MreC [Thermosynechococcus sp. TG215]WNC58750.1 rod shape-determining protein MreC [Thermosynechococcus sp. TG218]
MAFLLRWWGRYAGGLVLVALVLTSAWILRETNGAAIRELYRLLSLPFQGAVDDQQALIQARTWQLEQQLAAVQAENQRLRRMLNAPMLANFNGRVVPVIGRSSDQWWRSLLLGEGSRQGLTIGSVVVGNGGLVGRITSITPNTSRVMLLTDPASRVGVVVGRTRQMGILRGQLNQQVIVEFLEKDPKVQPKDVLYTSALSSLYPAGIPIGEVQSVELSDPTRPHATVILGAPIDRLEWVTVIPYAEPTDTFTPN